MKYIIVQAGGKGSRMELLTKNKPKALVPINNLPMIFHLFKKFPDSKYVIIGDYKFDVLERYLKTFATVDYQLVCATGHQKTCAGMKEAFSLIPDGERFLLTWCDLILEKDCILPDDNKNYVGISKDFPCRWKYDNGKFSEERSETHGVAGFFIFNNKSILSDIPEDGEFVRWLSSKKIQFDEFPLYGTKEYGLYSEWKKLPQMKCRPFNKLEIKDDKVYKTGINEQGKQLAVREVNWYKKMKDFKLTNIPKIFQYEPLCMEFIEGKNIYEYDFLPIQRKKEILKQIVHCLKEIHKLDKCPTDKESYQDAYLDKTFKRLEKIRDLVPFANDEYITINGKKCRNIFHHPNDVEQIVMRYMPKEFCVIHGDCTFSNMMLRHDEEPVLIDPRGYFGHIEILGDPSYDWVKLYYSLFSNYDQFNLKRFTLEINENKVRLDIASNNWENLESEFFNLLQGEVTKPQMKILLAITWLSLTTYAWEDYDSICGAFYNGIYYLEEALQMESAYDYFENNISLISNALRSISRSQFDDLVNDCIDTLRSNDKIIVSGLGKNVPIGEKFAGTMLSMGLNAFFLHTNSAVHGDMGMIKSGDLVIILSKSGETEESIYLYNLLKERYGVKIWLLSFREHSMLADRINKKIIARLVHEGDLWNIVPNNSTTINLIILQTLAIEISRRLGLDLNRDFRPNHPGGAIGAKLRASVDLDN